MKIIYHPEAEAELLDAIAYYAENDVQVADRFAQEIDAALELVVSLPTTWPILEDGVRRCLVNRFPYALLYRIEPDGIHIYAITHLRRRPGYWKHRRSE